ncbi:DUF1573 domain-containing protein [Polaribacter marinivivus]|jgi:hypothetical protein|uniref:DUF1573 domain-containing protein n=1 Tax=Polaribacter marinivivus TaxID=1524260 RepID=A0ABV8RC65_9FLAO|nr:DUF1573 domain-containing protein [uncultured Polaribacter sp.]
MRNLYWLITLVLIASSCNFRKPDLDRVKRTKMEVIDPERHYYPILRGSELTAAFQLYNRGNEPLIIYDVQASCGCIEIDFPETSIGKDDFGYIILDYDSAKNIGYVEFFVTILANTEGDVFTTIKFDLNVVTSPHYTQDYEEIYLQRRKENLGGEVDGDLTQQGYYTDEINGRTIR